MWRALPGTPRRSHGPSPYTRRPGDSPASLRASSYHATGAHVKVNLDIEAHLDAGFPDQIRRVVTQNTTDLKFDQAGFEKE